MTVDPKEAMDKFADKVLAYKPKRVKGSLLRKVGMSKGHRKKNTPSQKTKSSCTGKATPED